MIKWVLIMNTVVKFSVAAFLAAAALSPLTPASAQVTWTAWNTATTGLTTGTASGTLTQPGQTPITISYTGDVLFAQTNGVGINYWAPSSPYTSPAVPNAPPNSDIIALTGGEGTETNTFTFSSPVVNPILSINSLGAPGNVVDYNFSAPFDLLSQGTGYWGAGTLTQPQPNVLEGEEGDGTLRFNGTFNSISWNAPQSENWHGVTLGAAPALIPAPVPQPTTPVALGIGSLLLGGLLLAKKKKAMLA
jgi:hypothetical protein